MMTFTIAGDLLRQAVLRKWFLALGFGITLVLVLLGTSLRMDVVDGALAGTRLFGKVMRGDISAADVALRPVFAAATYVIYYGFTAFLILACADFAPALLVPGRIEHMLALPVRRFELLAGTYLGVLVLATLAAVYGAGGLCVLLGIKTGVWTFRPVLAALLTSVSFATIYAGMLLSALLARSAAISAAAGGVLFILGIVAGRRDSLLVAWYEGPTRTLFAAATGLLPRISSLGSLAAEIAGGEAVALGSVAALVGGFVLFVLGALALAVWVFERKDY
jgi:Cu-processing system permease protein